MKTKGADGYNPMRHDCLVDGCYNIKCHPKLEIFAESFPRNIGMTDIDGMVEIGGRALVLEWKFKPTTVIDGQFIAFQRLSASGVFYAIYAAGSPETMDVTHIAEFRKGKYENWRESDLSELKRLMKEWAVWADSQKGKAA